MANFLIIFMTFYITPLFSLRLAKREVLESEDVARYTSTCGFYLAREGGDQGLNKKECKTLPYLELGKDMSQIENADVWATWHHSYYQSDFRFQQAMQKLASGRDKFTIVVLGGSITHGQKRGCDGENNWVAVLRNNLQLFRGDDIEVLNLAKPSTTAGHVALNFQGWREKLSKADLIISEYNVNELFLGDLEHPFNSGKPKPGVQTNIGNPEPEAQTRRGDHGRHGRLQEAYKQNEAMLSLLLDLPKKPAFIYLDFPGFDDQRKDAFPAIEDMSAHLDVAKVFGVPIIWFSDLERQVGKQLFSFPRGSHPACDTHQNVAKLIHIVFQQAMGSVCEKGVQGEDAPRPHLQNEFQRKCADLSLLSVFASNSQNAFPIKSAGDWIFKEDVAGKPGWIAPSGMPSAIVFSGIPIKLGGLKIEYLRSYDENMGSLACTLEDENGQAKSMKLEGRWAQCVSMAAISEFSDIPEGKYDLRCRSDGAKFKILGLMSC